MSRMPWVGRPIGFRNAFLSWEQTVSLGIVPLNIFHCVLMDRFLSKKEQRVQQLWHLFTTVVIGNLLVLSRLPSHHLNLALTLLKCGLQWLPPNKLLTLLRLPLRCLDVGPVSHFILIPYQWGDKLKDSGKPRRTRLLVMLSVAFCVSCTPDGISNANMSLCLATVATHGMKSLMPLLRLLHKGFRFKIGVPCLLCWPIAHLCRHWHGDGHFNIPLSETHGHMMCCFFQQSLTPRLTLLRRTISSRWTGTR